MSREKGMMSQVLGEGAHTCRRHYLARFVCDGKQLVEGARSEIRDGAGASRKRGGFVGEFPGLVVRSVCQVTFDK